MRSKVIKNILLLVVWILSNSNVFCQQIENHFTHYTTKDGLADGLVAAITQDSSGFLWLGCIDGLSRFDGHTFKNYRYTPGDTTSLCENRIWGMFMDAEKRLWILTFHWLYLYHPDGEWFEHFGINALADDAFDNICAEEDGQLVLAGGKSLYKFDISKKKLSIFNREGVTGPRFRDYKKDERGREWIATDFGLTRYEPATKQTLKIPILVNALTFTDNGYLLGRTFNRGLCYINTETGATTQFLPDTGRLRLRGLYKLNDSIFLVGTDRGIRVFHLDTKTFTSIEPDPLNPTGLLPADKAITGIFRDREGIIWFGSEHLEKYDFKDFKINLLPPTGVEHHEPVFEKFSSLIRCAKGIFLFGSYHGLGIYDPSVGMVKIANDTMFRDKIVSHMLEDASGRIWSNTMVDNHKPKLCVFNFKNGQVENTRQYDIPRCDVVSDMTLDSRGNVLIATSGKGLVIFDTTNKTFSFFDTVSGLSPHFTSLLTTAVCADRYGRIWVGTRKGLNRIGSDGRTVKQFSQNKAFSFLLPDYYITDIKEDKNGAIWFTTREHGMGRIDPHNDSLIFFSNAQGLPTPWCKGLCIDDDNNIWGLSKLGMINININTLQNKLYNEDQGFPFPDDLGAPDDRCSVHFSRYTGKLYLLTPYCIFEIDPKSKIHNGKIPQTKITAFSVFDKERAISGTDGINLKYDENFINIGFACLLFHNNDQVKYAYKMEGVDKDWVYCNYKRNASYTNLSPGRYRFNVKAQSPEGVWNSAPTMLSIIISPPVWQTWWFYLAELAAVVSIVFWIIRLYTARKLMQQKNEFEKLRAVTDERARIASEMHDELGSGLTSIRLLSEIAGGKINHDVIPKSEIEKIERSASNLSENLREIIWTMNTRFDKLDDFIVYVRTYAVEYFDDSAINFHFNSPRYIPEITLNGELRRNLFLCIKEALHNIVKHSRATEASLTFNVEESSNKPGHFILATEIKDNGVGIDASHLHKFGNGLNTMKERLGKFGSSLEIGVNKGTKMSFKIKI